MTTEKIDATIELAGHVYPFERLVASAMRNLKARKGELFWSTVMKTFGVGSTVAWALCEWAGRNAETGAKAGQQIDATPPG